MTRKRRTIIIVTVIVVLLLFLFFVIVAVIAARQGSLNSNISVNYYAKEIYADISANVIQSDGTVTAMVNKDDNNNDLISFDNRTSNVVAVGTLEPIGIILLDTNSRYVVFEFKFENKSSDHNLVVSMSSLPTISGSTSAYKANFLVTTTRLTENFTTEINEDEVGALILEPKQTGYVYAIVKVLNTGDDTDYSIQFSWDLVQG